MSGPFGSSQWMYSSGGGGFYDQPIEQSLRFNDDDTAYLSRTPSSTGNRRTWTFSAWVKRTGSLGSYQALITAGYGGSGSNARLFFGFDSSGRLITDIENIGSYNQSAALYRDVGAWYHIVWKFDATNATATERSILYVNGERIQDNYPITFSNADYHFNNTIDHRIGYNTSAALFPLDAYMSDVYFVDGSALDPTSFGEYKSGVWIPKAYSGSYGTNGFHLEFANSGSLGTDTSGNSNNWTANNLAATDQVLDSPTNNFCVMDQNARGFNVPSYKEGALRIDSSGTDIDSQGHATWHISSGKWYWEHRVIHVGDDWIHLGVTDVSAYNYMSYDGYIGQRSDHWSIFLGTGTKRHNNTTTSYGSTFNTGDIAMTALDMDSGKIWWGKNGTWIASGDPAAGTNAAFTNLSGYQVTPAFTARDSGVFNFGQDSSFAGGATAQGNKDDNNQGDFYYTPPSGYLALCSANLSVPEAIDPAEDNSPQDYFKTILYSGLGNGGSVTGVGFRPNLVWLKEKPIFSSHYIYDVARHGGLSNSTAPRLESNNANAEVANNQGISSFDTDGFTYNQTNSELDGNMVGWCWRAGDAPSSNTSGSITSNVSVNQDAGVSLLTYTGNGVTGATVGHGLGKVPAFYIVRWRNNNSNYHVYHQSTGATKGLILNKTDPVGTNAGFWNNTAPTSSVFSLGYYGGSNSSGGSFVAWCFAEIEGFSKFSSYTGNGSDNGTFVYTGFRPAFLIIKQTNADRNWIMVDSKRDPHNVTDTILIPNSSNSEIFNTGTVKFDLLSNGFKLRIGHVESNGNNDTYAYMAFAENPFKYANAR